jgi:hypothetical protein
MHLILFTYPVSVLSNSVYLEYRLFTVVMVTWLARSWASSVAEHQEGVVPVFASLGKDHNSKFEVQVPQKA